MLPTKLSPTLKKSLAASPNGGLTVATEVSKWFVWENRSVVTYKDVTYNAVTYKDVTHSNESSNVTYKVVTYSKESLAASLKEGLTVVSFFTKRAPNRLIWLPKVVLWEKRAVVTNKSVTHSNESSAPSSRTFKKFSVVTYKDVTHSNEGSVLPEGFLKRLFSNVTYKGVTLSKEGSVTTCKDATCSLHGSQTGELGWLNRAQISCDVTQNSVTNSAPPAAQITCETCQLEPDLKSLRSTKFATTDCTRKFILRLTSNITRAGTNLSKLSAHSHVTMTRTTDKTAANKGVSSNADQFLASEATKEAETNPSKLCYEFVTQEQATNNVCGDANQHFVTHFQNRNFEIATNKLTLSKPQSLNLRISMTIKTRANGTFSGKRHIQKVKETAVQTAGDVEMNPGPRNPQPETKLTLVTQNCRGITDEKKLKHLLNNSHKLGKRGQKYIVALQETMITNDSKIKYGWRGNHVFTAGTGHGRGCVTLLPNDIQPDIDTIVQLGQRGHIFEAVTTDGKMIIANIYAPNGQTRDKIDFFREVCEALAAMRQPTDDVYLMGDFNTVFEHYEVMCRSYNEQEQRHATQIKQIINALALEDGWQSNKTAHTWRQAGTRKSSRLDRIYFLNNLKKESIEVDWTFTNSDHGAVIATFVDGITTAKQRLLRLNPDLLNEKDAKETFLGEYRAQIQGIPQDWSPHQKLEFHKCAMRSAYAHASAEKKKRITRDYEFLKEDLHTHVRLLEEGQHNVARKNRIMNKINTLKAQITKLNLEKGQKLANRLKTKWYNEGERSNKYFLAMLRKKEANGQLKELIIEDREESEPERIENYVTDFYKKLYNQKFERGTEEEQTRVLRSLEPLNREELLKINQPLTLEILRNTLQGTSDSCPGPDGIPYSYLKATWGWYGPTLLEAWEHSLRTNSLPESHRVSWLRLIPKAGKNTKDLKNWRPITLSNCDHKIITKALSKILAENIERIVSGNQTAYLKSRSIADNLRLVALANKIANRDTNIKGLLIALDAQKAFDSVSHDYIKSVLEKIGLESFKPIFDLLYRESRVDILINEKVCKGYHIGNGVKQGDALSCTLFILAMEPLIRNIEANPSIKQLRSTKYDIAFPKCIGYADDINIITDRTVTSVRAAIGEYEKFSKVSGLVLNADKTEIFDLSPDFNATDYSFTYQGKQNIVRTTNTIKINGVLFATDPKETHRLNFESIKAKMDNQFAAWANRGLTLLGKVLIYKTFGLSQLVYVMRVLTFTTKENKDLRNLIYKFLWNRNYQTNKAPDRIKRTNLMAEIKDGGFGMIDHEAVVKAMNAKQVLTNLQGNHPIKAILTKLMKGSSFHKRLKESLDGPGVNYCEVLSQINRKLLVKDVAYLQQDRLAKNMMLNEKLSDIARPDRRNSIELTLLRHQGKTTVRHLLTDNAMANHFRLRILHYEYATLMDACLLSPNQDPINDVYIPIRDKYKMATKTSSKSLRLELTENNGIENFKITVPRQTVIDMLPKIKKLRCVRAKNLALRILHGDIFTGEKMFKLGMTDTDQCQRCDRRESLEHMLKDCWYPTRIWSYVYKIYRETDQRRQIYNINSLEFPIAAKVSAPKLKLHLEIIRRLTNKVRPSILPRALIRQSLDYLIICDLQHGTYYRKLKRALENNI